MKRIISIMLIISLCFLSVSQSTYAGVDSGYNIEEIQDKIVETTMDTYSENSKGAREFEVYCGGKLNHTVLVDLEGDRLVICYPSGKREEHVLSQTVTVVQGINSTRATLQTVETESDIITRSTDYLMNEPFEINAAGVQISLGTTVYSGYEAMGSRFFTNPTETGYLQRKAMGNTATFDSYNFEVQPGISLGAVASAIYSLLRGKGLEVVLDLIQDFVKTMFGRTLDTILDNIFGGKFRCREYQWNYRVRHNSNTGTILMETFRHKYWWEMYDQRTGKRIFKKRNNIVDDGWGLSNADMVAHALGRM